MLEYIDDGLCEYMVASLLFQMYAELIRPHEQKMGYIEYVKDYIKALYMKPISVENIANQINLDRRYLSRIFKQNTGMTIQEYIIHIRMNEAKKLLRQEKSIEEVSLLCGYDDRSNFSKFFKRKS